jgi:hypothetical protein
MINPQRPLIVYKSMSFKLDTLDVGQIELRLSGHNLEVNGKRGDVTLEYDVYCKNNRVGRGSKRILLGGLRQFDQHVMQQLIDEHTRRREAFKQLNPH